MDSPRIMVLEKRLSLSCSQKKMIEFCAYCPELDLATEMDTYAETIGDMIEAIKEYAEEYMADYDLYSKSPNRAHHLPYIDAVKSCSTDWDRKGTMKIEYSKEADALYVYFKEEFVAKSKEIEDGVVIDFDEKGQLIGIEVLDVSQRFSLSDIVNVNIENLPVEAIK